MFRRRMSACPRRRLPIATRSAHTKVAAKNRSGVKENASENLDTSFSIANAEPTRCREGAESDARLLRANLSICTLTLSTFKQVPCGSTADFPMTKQLRCDEFHRQPASLVRKKVFGLG